MNIVTVSPASPDACSLIAALDAEIAATYPGLPINGIDAAEFERAGGYFVIARDGGEPLACGAFRPVEGGCAEIKRMFVRPDIRRQGLARAILLHLEAEIRCRGFAAIAVETGCDQHAAIRLYEAEGYFPIPPFLGYVGNPISRCFAKRA